MRIEQAQLGHGAKRALRSWRRALGVPLLLPALSLWSAASAFGQNASVATPTLTERNVQNAASAAPVNANGQPGVPMAEIVRLNGGQFGGYPLTRGNILPDTMVVTLNGSRLQPNKDYMLDAVNGTIYLTRPASRYDSLSVYYRYLEGQPATRQAGALPGLKFNLGGNGQIGLMFGSSAGNGNGLLSTTYGLAMNSRFGSKGAGTLQGMAFFSNLQKSDNVQLGVSAQALESANAAAPETGADHLLTQNLGYRSGNINLRADFQDIGAKFSGFQTMRQNFAGNADALNQLSQLEGERGVKRLGFGLDVNTGKKGQTGQGFALGFSQIQDENGSIAQQSAELNLSNLRVSYAAREVGQNFQRFGGLREAQKDQWARERGMTSRAFGLGYSFGLGKKATPGGLDFVSQSFGDAQGSLERMALGFNAGNFGFQMTNRRGDAAFNRLNDLSASDKTALALDLYRQFDPNAKAEQVTDADRQMVAQETGFERNALRTGFGFGKGGGLSYSQFQVKDGALANGDGASNAFRRDNFALNSSRLNFVMTRQQAGTQFNRLANLSLIERGNMVLDVMRTFDPKFQLAQVNPNDLNFITRSAGLAREMMRTDLSLSQSANLSYSQFGVTEKKGEGESATAAQFRRDALTLQSKNFDLAFVSHMTTSDFLRIADLTDFEKSVLALDIRRQFDPNAQLDQITPKERELAPRESGLSRTFLNANLRLGKDEKKGALSVRQFTITGATPDQNANAQKPAVKRQNVEYANKRIKVAVTKQSVSPNFTRLPELNDIERAQLGNERGLNRDQLDLTYQLNRATRIGFSSLSVAGNREAVAEAVAAAQQGQGDAQAAAKSAGSGVSRQTFSLETKGLNLTTQFAQADKGFNRVGDLAVSDADRQSIQQDLGYRRFDYNAQVNLVRGVTAESFRSSAVNAEDRLGRERYRHALSFTPNKRTTLQYTADGDLTSIDSLRNGVSHGFFNLTHNFGRGVALNVFQDDLRNFAKGDVTGGAKTDFLRFHTAQDKPNRLLMERRSVALYNGAFENTSYLNMHFKPAKAFTFGYSKQDVDRTASASETTDFFDFQWQAAKNFAIIGGFSQRDLLDPEDKEGKGDVHTVSVGLSGQPVPHLTVTAKFDEVHQVAQNTKNTADISLSNAKPIRLGPIEDLTITARFATANDQRRLMNETMAGRFAWKMWRNEFVFDYGGFTQQNGSFTNRIYAFTTDPSPKKWFRASAMYKARTLLDGTEYSIRRYTLDARLSKRTHLVYTFGTLPEDERGNILPQETIDLSFKHEFRPKNSFNFFYRMNSNQATQIMTRSLGFGYEAQFNATSKLLLAFSVDGNDAPGRWERSNFFQVNFEKAFGAESFFNLSARIRNFTSPGIQDDVQAFLDFRLRF